MERGCLCRRIALGPATPAIYAGPDRRDDLPQCLSVYRHSQGLLSAAGHGTDVWKYFGSAGYVVPNDAAEIDGIHGYRNERSGGEKHVGEHRRRRRKYRQDEYRIETDRR